MDNVVVFGEIQANIAYRERPGVYGIIFDFVTKRILTVRTPLGVFLPGGGIEENETHEQCLQRECLEELGRIVTIGTYVGRAKNYFYSTMYQEPMLSDGYFYLASLGQQVQMPVEADHELVWTHWTAIDGQLWHQHQVWAVKTALRAAGLSKR